MVAIVRPAQTDSQGRVVKSALADILVPIVTPAKTVGIMAHVLTASLGVGRANVKKDGRAQYAIPARPDIMARLVMLVKTAATTGLALMAWKTMAAVFVN